MISFYQWSHWLVSHLLVLPVYVYDFYVSMKDSYHHLFIYHEPEDEIWLNELTLVQEKDLFQLKNNYHIHESMDFTTEEYYENYCLRTETDKYHLEFAYCLVQPHRILYRTWNKHRKQHTCFQSNQKSNVSFLYIEYFHPNMRHTIEFTIPKRMFFVNNELLSSCFILRLLQRQSQSYIFDEKYRIHCIDLACESYTFFSYEYICLKQNDFDICKNESLYNLYSNFDWDEEPMISKYSFSIF